MNVAEAQTVAVRTERAPRVVSIDVFRGLTMILMIFVNDLAEIKGLPWWNYHAPAKIDAMTYVDMVFPAFLFILGMAIPLAVEQRLKKNPSMLHLWLHVISRSIALVVLGLILANAEAGDRALMGINTNVWTILGLLGGVLFWMVYPRTEKYRPLFLGLRVSGLVLMVVMFAIFRRTTRDGHIGWIKTSYPEILGLLGLTYLAVCILYLPTRRWVWAPAVWFVALTAFCAACTAHWIGFPRHIPLYVWPFGNGAMASIAMAGVVTSTVFVGAPSLRWPKLRQKMSLAIAFAVLAILAGWLMTPLGISKIRATPTWCLCSIGASVLLFALLYWICDVKRQTAWAAFTRPAGSNTLLTYLLPDFYYFILRASGVTWFETHWNWGVVGALRCVLFTAFILGAAEVLTRWKLRLQL